MKAIILLTAISLFVFSCKKKHTLKVSAINKITGAPASNANVYIIEETNKVGSMGGGTVTHEFYNGYTNNDGLLTITKKFDNRYNYKIWLQTFDQTGSKLLYSHYFHGDSKDPVWKTGVNFEVIPMGYLKLSIHNVNCQGAGDTMRLERVNLSVPEYDGFSPISFTGCFNYDSADSAKVPSGKWQFKWIVNRSGMSTIHDTVFNLNENECSWIQILY